MNGNKALEIFLSTTSGKPGPSTIIEQKNKEEIKKGVKRLEKAGKRAEILDLLIMYGSPKLRTQRELELKKLYEALGSQSHEIEKYVEEQKQIDRGVFEENILEEGSRKNKISFIESTIIDFQEFFDIEYPEGIKNFFSHFLEDISIDEINVILSKIENNNGTNNDGGKQISDRY